MAIDGDGQGSLTLARPAFHRRPIADTRRDDMHAVDAQSLFYREPIQLRVKRALDLLCALVLLVVLAPILVAVAVLVWLDSPGPILFRQSRIGLGGRQFVMYKFRTMLPDCDLRVHRDYYSQLIKGVAPPDQGLFKLRADARVTRIGRFLRRFSLDELPQLVNVVQGSMSLVGPRPPIAYEVEEYGPRELLRLQAKPGLTGLWQVSGRNLLNFQDMIELDLEYVERWSIWLDIWILLRTPLTVLTAYGAN